MVKTKNPKENIEETFVALSTNSFHHDLQFVINNNPKKFWTVISPQKHSERISLQDDSGAPISEESSVAFNNFFTSMFTREDYSTIPSITDVNYRYMAPITIDASGISSLIKNLKVSTSAGVDGINNKILKHTVTYSATILSRIFEQSLSTGELPYDWKVGKIIPIFKSGDKSKISNYRPIS